MAAKTRRYVTTDPATLTWQRSASGAKRFTIVRGAYKLSDLTCGLFVLERLGDDELPAGVLGTFETLDAALERIDLGPAFCQRCGHSVVPGYEVPDPTMPCPTR